MSKKNVFRDIVAKMMEAVTMDDNGVLQTIDETAKAEADEMFSAAIVEQAQEWWTQLESAESSLAAMSDEISFAELNTDPSHVSSPALDLNADGPETTMESILGTEEFNLGSIFEMQEDDEFGPADGDEEFDDLMTGNDEEGIGGDTGMGDDMGGMDGTDGMDAIGGDGDMGDFSDEGDEFSDEGDDFEFDFLDDDMGDGMGDDFGDEGGMEEMNHLDTMHESDDDDEDKDDDVTESDDDEDEDDKDKDDE